MGLRLLSAQWQAFVYCEHIYIAPRYWEIGKFYQEQELGKVAAVINSFFVNLNHPFWLCEFSTAGKSFSAKEVGAGQSGNPFLSAAGRRNSCGCDKTDASSVPHCRLQSPASIHTFRCFQTSSEERFPTCEKFGVSSSFGPIDFTESNNMEPREVCG